MLVLRARALPLSVCILVSSLAFPLFAGQLGIPASVGNLVWEDLDNDGILDPGEPGIQGVSVELRSADGATFLGSTTTGAGGLYQFSELSENEYRIRLVAQNFNPAGVLRDYRSSTGPLPGVPYEPAPDPDTVPVDSDDNGTERGGLLGLGGYIESEAVTISAGDNQLGVDFGVTHQPQIDLMVTKTDGASDYSAGGTRVYTIVLTNNGPADANGMTVNDARPSQVASWTWVCAPGTPPGVNCSDDASNPATFLDTLDLPVLGSVTYTVTALISPAASGDLSNQVFVVPPPGMGELTPADNSATDVDTLRTADLSLTKSDGVTQVEAGGTTTYTIVVANAGPVAAVDALVMDDLPSPPLTCTWTCAGTNGGACPAAGAGDLDESVDLPAGASATFAVVCDIAIDFSGQLTNSASVIAPADLLDTNAANNSATDIDSVGAAAADLTLVKSVTTPNVHVGEAADFLLTVTNQGPGPATGVVVIDTLPAELVYVANDCGATFAASTLTWNVGALAISGSAFCTLTATVSTATSITNTATVGGNEVDPTPGDNSASATVLGGQSVVEVPALDEVGLALLALGLAVVALARLRR